MSDLVVSWLGGISTKLTIALIAMLPVAELRGAIPIGIASFDLNLYSVFFYAYLGNLVPIFLIFWIFPPLIKVFSRHFKWFQPFLDKYFLSLEKKYQEKYDRYGSLILVLLVAIPLPGSGVWTASILAVLFKVEKRYSIPAILIGLAIAGLIVTLITQGALGAFKFLI